MGNGTRTMPVRLRCNARASLHVRRAELLREGNYYTMFMGAQNECQTRLCCVMLSYGIPVVRNQYTGSTCLQAGMLSSNVGYNCNILKIAASSVFCSMPLTKLTTHRALASRKVLRGVSKHAGLLLSSCLLRQDVMGNISLSQLQVPRLDEMCHSMISAYCNIQ